MIVFYVKTTSWIVLPLVIGLIAGQFIKNQTLFFAFIMIGFGITCFGIYQEIKEYKKTLNPPSHKATADKGKNGNK